MSKLTATSKTCRGRDSTLLGTYIKNPALARKLFANALESSDYLSRFDGFVEASECIFSYPESEWYSVYLLDSDGNRFFDYRGNREAQLFFKIQLAPSGRSANIIQETTDISETDIGDKQNCAINENGNCGNPKAPAKAKAPPKAKASKKSEAGPSEPIPDDVMGKLTTLSLSTGGGSSKSKASSSKPKANKGSTSRDFFDSMESKMQIVEWMINNMNKEDILECIRRGSLSDSDKSKAEAVSMVPDEIVELAQQLPKDEVRKMLQRITKEDIIKDINSKFKSSDEKMNGISQLCEGAGKIYRILQTKRGPVMVDKDNDPVGIDVALDECAAFEAERIRQRIVSKWKSATRMAPRLAKDKMPVVEEQIEEPSVPQLTAESIISEIDEIDDPVAKKNAIIALCEECGWSSKPGKRGIQILDNDGEPVSDKDDLTECAQIKAARMAGFGRRRRRTTRKRPQTVFKKAAKKCKKSSKKKGGYISCMKRTLRQMYSFGKKKINAKKYTSAGGRKSPGISATSKPVGTVMKGLDGNMWVIKKSKTGVKRWVKK